MFCYRRQGDRQVFHGRGGKDVGIHKATLTRHESNRTFADGERAECVDLWSVDEVQFARFIAECESCGVFTNDERMSLVADSMDLAIDQLVELIDRASDSYELMKARF